MKQKGKTWYTQKNEAIPSKFVPKEIQITERLGHRIADMAIQTEQQLSKLKYDIIRLCQEVYEASPKGNVPAKTITFYTFDHSFKIEYDAQNGHVRVYRSTKPDPGHKDYVLVNMDFSHSNPLNLPRNKKERKQREDERNAVPIHVEGDSLSVTFPLSEENAKALQHHFDGKNSEKLMSEKPEEEDSDSYYLQPEKPINNNSPLT